MSYIKKDFDAVENSVPSNYVLSKSAIPPNRIYIKSCEKGSLESEKQFAYEDVLQLIGFGKTQWIMLFTCGLLLMMVINETMGMSIITIASQCDFDSTSMDKAIMSAAAFIGKFSEL